MAGKRAARRPAAGQRVGYIRVSSIDQNTSRQLDGVPLDRTFTDNASGRDQHRPQLEAMLGFVRTGDTVIVHSMDRLARNLGDLRGLVAKLTGNGVEVQFVKEQLTFTDADNPMGTLLLSVMGAFDEFERSLIRERQREGIELARRRGAYRGRPRTLNDKQTVELRRRAGAGKPKALLAFGISRQTVYEYLREVTSVGTNRLVQAGRWSPVGKSCWPRHESICRHVERLVERSSASTDCSTGPRERLVVVRLGATTLADRRLSDACDRSYERWGGLGVLGVGGSGRGRLPEARPPAPIAADGTDALNTQRRMPLRLRCAASSRRSVTARRSRTSRGRTNAVNA